MDRITDIKRRLDGGEDFAELAKEYSDDPTSANLGGDMGWFPPEAYGDRVAQTLNRLAREGEISEPFQTVGGWHIIQMLGHARDRPHSRRRSGKKRATRSASRRRSWKSSGCFGSSATRLSSRSGCPAHETQTSG
jgi:parvulin-like peptidyl-prolyl isomerase